MSRAEMYPWSSLHRVGDFFIVPYSIKPHSYVSMMVNQRNYRMKENGPHRWCSFKAQFGTIVFLAEIIGQVPEHDFATPDGVLGFNSDAKPAPPGAPPLTLFQKVAKLNLAEKQMNLPWWFSDGQLIFNPQVATSEDLDKWYHKVLRVTPDTPYPDYYHLDENLIRRPPAPDSEDEDDEVEPWSMDDAPIIED